MKYMKDILFYLALIGGSTNLSKIFIIYYNN